MTADGQQLVGPAVAPEHSCGWLWWDLGRGGALVSVLCFAKFPGLDSIRLQAARSDLLESGVPGNREEGRRRS